VFESQPPTRKRQIGCLVLAIVIVGALGLAAWGLKFF
jgi:hypothetical protein